MADYDRPPVMEVAYGIKFAPLQAWRLPHVGLFWQRILGAFPRCEHARPIAGSEFVDSTTGFPIPRIWLISDTDDRLVQLQSDRFLFNWRRRDSAVAYPRYNALSQRFFELLQEFRDFITKNHLGEINALEFELTYINHIIEQDGWQFPDNVGRVVEHLAWQSNRYEFLPKPIPTNWQCRFAFPEGPGTLFVKLNTARNVKEGKDLLILELSARGLPAGVPLDNAKGWFARAHRWIVRGFEDLTSDEAQRTLWVKHERG